MITEFSAQTESAIETMRAEVRAGLTAVPKVLPPKYFYDERGSALFDQITRLPEYYPTRAETAILHRYSAEIAELSQCQSLVELGSGTSAKTRLLLDALRDAGPLRRFVPFDVDPAVLGRASAALSADYPALQITPVVGDFERDLTTISTVIPTDGRRMIAFLGSTIGNLDPQARAAFLAQVSASMRPGDSFLLGTDLVKDVTRLQRAYDDAAGVTAQFNRNVLVVLNRQLHADFAVEDFAHVARWDAENEWIEMRLRSVRAQRVTLADLDLAVSFGAGEEIRTEISAKFRSEGVRDELRAAGLALQRLWTDPDGDFALSIAHPV